MLSSFYYTITNTCFTYNNKWYKHLQEWNQCKLIEYQTEYCKNNNNEESEKEIVQCIYSKENKIWYEFLCSIHYVTY